VCTREPCCRNPHRNHIRCLIEILSAAQNLTLQGLYPSVHMDPGQWAATISALRDLRHLKLGLIDDRSLPALSALTGLTLLHLGIRHREDLSPVRCWVTRICKSSTALSDWLEC